MDTFVSKSKRTKKEKKALDAKLRKTWDGFCPVTQIIPNKKKYNRKKFNARRFDFEE